MEVKNYEYTEMVIIRFCAIIISLGVVLFGCQYSYAHSPELKVAKIAAKQNPIMENLERLYALYKQNVKYHKSEGELDKAEKSARNAVEVKMHLVTIMEAKVAECYESLIKNLGLRKPIYRKLASYGHMGRNDLAVKWGNLKNIA